MTEENVQTTVDREERLVSNEDQRVEACEDVADFCWLKPAIITICVNVNTNSSDDPGYLTSCFVWYIETNSAAFRECFE